MLYFGVLFIMFVQCVCVIHVLFIAQVRLVCSAAAPPGELFTRGKITLREEDMNRMLMDDLGLKAVSIVVDWYIL